jgi:hypothetical protein
MSVRTAEDRSLVVQPHQTVATRWVEVERCVIACRERMSPEAVERKYRRLLQQGDAACWPPIVGHWREDGRFVVCDGRHELLASQMLGREKVLVCWLTDGGAA